MPVAMAAVVAGFLSISICAARGYLLLYGDAVAHLGIARRILDTRYPGVDHMLRQLGGVWLPLPHLLMLPFIQRMEWWQNGLAGTWPSLICFVLAVIGFYRLSRRLLTPRWAMVSTAFFGLNANLLYLATTAMTEPLFLALVVWMVDVAMGFVDAVKHGRRTQAERSMLMLGALILGSVMTRYDGWILGAAVWSLVAWQWFRAPRSSRPSPALFVVFTLITLAGPVSWFAYNQHYFHDWLDFMRGPYSAREIDRKTTPPGAGHYLGWHNPAWSLLLYTRTAQVVAAWWETGWLLMLAAVAGAALLLRARAARTALLLWVPLPFYVYSISYGSVPIFIPQLYPYAFYNSRYGMEMLPALALYGAFALSGFVRRLRRFQPLAERLAQPLALLFIVVNLILMMHATPLVLKEAQANSVARVAIEDAIAAQLRTFTPGAPIMMDSSHYVGALQHVGIPLAQTMSPEDAYKEFTAPADKAAYVIAGAGDSVDEAVKKHPDGLTELTILCTTGVPCVRVYKSDRFVPEAQSFDHGH